MHHYLNKYVSSDEIVIVDSFPMPLGHIIRDHRASVSQEDADTSYNASKKLLENFGTLIKSSLESSF